MGARIMFIAAFVMLLAGFLAVKKASGKISFFKSAVICLITELCLGAVIGGCFKLIKIPVGLLAWESAFGYWH